MAPLPSPRRFTWAPSALGLAFTLCAAGCETPGDVTSSVDVGSGGGATTGSAGSSGVGSGGGTTSSSSAGGGTGGSTGPVSDPEVLVTADFPQDLRLSSTSAFFYDPAFSGPKIIRFDK